MAIPLSSELVSFGLLLAGFAGYVAIEKQPEKALRCSLSRRTASPRRSRKAQ